MTRIFAAFLLSTSLFCINSLLSYAESDDHTTGHAVTHDEHGHSGHSLDSIKKGKTFPSTPEFKVRMEKIKALVHQAADKKADQKQVSAYGVQIEETVQDIFKTCQLEKEADEAAHPILGEILKGASFLKKGDFKKGHDAIHHAFQVFQEIFVDQSQTGAKASTEAVIKK